MTTVLLILFSAVAVFVFGFFVGRNHPNLAAVNRILEAGKAIVDATGKIVKK